MVENVTQKHLCSRLQILLKCTLFIIIIFGIIIAIAFAISYSGILTKIVKHDIFSESYHMYSYRYERVKSALNIFNNIDENVNPCDNFYKFACGKFINSTQQPLSITQLNKFAQSNNYVFNQLHKVIIQINETSVPKPFKLVKKLYNICMNITAIENLGFKPLSILLEKLGHWPILKGDWNETTFSWEEFIYNIKKIGLIGNYFITSSITSNPKNNSQLVIQLDQPSLEFPRQRFTSGTNDTAVKAYYEYMKNIAEILGMKRDKIQDELLDVLNFEIDLSRISSTVEERRNTTKLYNPMTINDLHKHWPMINWNTFLLKTYEPYIQLDDDDIIIVTNTSFILDFQQLIIKTPKIVQKNYALWKTIKFTVPYLNKEIRKPAINYSATRSGVTSETAQWATCVNVAKSNLHLSTDALYVRANMKKTIKPHITEMVIKIKDELIDILHKMEWLDEITRVNAINKAKAIIAFVAYSDELFDDDKLTEYYDSLELDDGNFLQSIMNINLFKTQKLYKKYREPRNRTDWTALTSFLDVNAFNMISKNMIVILSGILQDAFFNSDRPAYMNYGSIGSIIGHELFHSFDDQGRLFDKDGNLVDWWTEYTKTIFRERAMCFVNQYNNYTIDQIGIKVNGALSQGENIADSNGLRISYLAYKKWMKIYGPEPGLPELPYTSEQLFWITFGTVWCTIDNKEILTELSTNVHAPNALRVIGSVSNIPEFSVDFNCPFNSNMNPDKKCILW